MRYIFLVLMPFILFACSESYSQEKRTNPPRDQVEFINSYSVLHRPQITTMDKAAASSRARINAAYYLKGFNFTYNRVKGIDFSAKNLSTETEGFFKNLKIVDHEQVETAGINFLRTKIQISYTEEMKEALSRVKENSKVFKFEVELKEKECRLGVISASITKALNQYFKDMEDRDQVSGHGWLEKNVVLKPVGGKEKTLKVELSLRITNKPLK